MASIINASSSGSGGLVQTADASGVLQLQNNGTVAVVIDSGNTYINCTSSQIPTVGVGRLNINGSQGLYVSGYGDALGFGSVFKQSASAAGNNGWPIYFVSSAEATVGGVRQRAAAVEYMTTGSGSTGAILLNSGVQFPATQVASADPNTLDDYEEGSFTPLIQNVDGSQSVSLGVAGSYVKIGRTVNINISAYAVNTSAISAGNHMFLRGLPFSATAPGTGAAIYVQSVMSQYPSNIVSIIDMSGTAAPLYVTGGAQDWNPFTRNSWGGASSISWRMSFTYQAAA